MDRPLPWLAAEDLGAIVASAFAEPGSYVGEDRALAADVRPLSECRAIWRRVTGRDPRRFPMPLWLFHKFVGPDLARMWRWLATHDVDVDPSETREHNPNALTVEQFLDGEPSRTMGYRPPVPEPAHLSDAHRTGQPHRATSRARAATGGVQLVLSSSASITMMPLGPRT